MKTKTFLLALLVSFNTTGFSTIWTITNSGLSFSPDSVTITDGDSVNFVLTSIHNAREVDQATWVSNGTTAMPGGFDIPFGGGMVLPSFLGPGIHYFVCSSHVLSGMKGVITVQTTSGVKENFQGENFSVFPTPSRGKFQLLLTSQEVSGDCHYEIFDITGTIINRGAFGNSKTEIDAGNRPGGIYFLKLYNGQSIITRKIIIE